MEQLTKQKTAKNTEKKQRNLLGDKWLDWDGLFGKDVQSADTAVAVVLALAGLGIILFMGFLFLIWYLITPRLEQFHSSLPWIFGGLAIAFSGFMIVVAASVVFTLRTGKNFLIIKNIHNILVKIIKILQRLGRKFGVSADRVSNSLLKVNNALILASRTFTGKESILLLLPRCLSKEVRQKIMKVVEATKIKHATCVGGEEARKQILLQRPEVVVAVACERDLIAGIQDINAALPVIGIPNSRPMGPCTCTELDVDSLSRTLSLLTGKAAENK